MNNLKIVVDKRLKNIYFPIEDRVISKNIEKSGSWEESDVLWLLENISEGMKCVNVGANVGYFTMLLSNLVKDTGEVYAFEPVKHINKILQLNVNSLKYKNVKIFNKALGNCNKKINMYINYKNCGASTCFNPNKILNIFTNFFTKKSKIQIVDMCTLDSLLSNNKIDFILIDAEGFDIFILEGAKKILKNNNLIVVFEFTPTLLDKICPEYLKILNDVMDMGYSLHALLNTEILVIRDQINQNDIFKIMSCMNKRKTQHINLTFKKNNLRGDVYA